MRKSTLFISATLTMFLMATLFGVVSAYQEIVKNNEAAQATSQPVAVVVEPTATLPSTEQPLVITPEQATTIAIEFLGDPNVFSVESVVYEDAPAYLVTFSSGDLVYVSPSGEIITNTKLEPVIVVAQSGNGRNSDNNNGGGNGGGDDEDHDDHDDDHDDDD